MVTLTLLHIMENHLKKLQSVCRLCRTSILNSPRKCKYVSEYAQEIKKLFSYDIKKDDLYIHPNLICDSCRRKMDECKKVDKVFCTDIAVFTKHDTDCTICKNLKTLEKHFYKVSKEKFEIERQVEVLSMNHVVDVAKTCGFIEVVDNVEKNWCIFYKIQVDKNNFIVTDLSVKIYRNFSWTIYAFSKQVTSSGKLMQSFPSIIDSSTVEMFFNELSRCNVCIGNADFKDIIDRKLSKGEELNFKDKQNNVKAKLQNKYLSDVQDCTTIRSVNCDVLVLDDCKFR